MKKKLVILGSTGSIGSTTLSSIKNIPEFEIKCLSTNRNIKKLYSQAKLFKVKNVIVEKKNIYLKYKDFFKKKKIKLHYGIHNIDKIIKKKVDYCINSLSGIDGLEPTLKIIPRTKNILIANKESIICGWHLIKKKLNKHNTKFIPIDSEHYSIMKLIQGENIESIDKIILTASGGPFLNKSKKQIANISPKEAINHPNWKMGKKISIDSSNMMNKIYEYIEAKKIFNLSNSKLSILIHPNSYVHAIINLKGGLIKFLAHDTNMRIPILNALGIKKKTENIFSNKSLKSFNNLKFKKPTTKQFPLLNILNIIPNRTSYFETILITLNDSLVKKYLNKHINYISIQKNLLKIIKKPYLKKYYKLKPNSVYDIKKMILITNDILRENLKIYEK